MTDDKAGINGIPNLDQIKVVNPVAEMVRELLRLVESGQITDVAIVGAGPQGFVTPFSGANPLMLYLGADVLKDQIKAAMFSQQKRSPIIRPGAGMMG